LQAYTSISEGAAARKKKTYQKPIFKRLGESY
jgi:hypothetical protein